MLPSSLAGKSDQFPEKPDRSVETDESMPAALARRARHAWMSPVTGTIPAPNHETQ